MRLINTQTFQLKDFGINPEPYAILSHTWGEDEVTFQDMADLDAARRKKGFSKIEQCCRQSRQDGFDWAWVDTCCIDKTSSAELSETINSMFNWYGRAMKCYALLSDVIAGQDALFLPSDQESDEELDDPLDPPHPRSVFFSSRWWTRGWTLQELIAPHDVEFYDRDWKYLTCKRVCKDRIGKEWRIAVPVLDHSRALASFCLAERISWASDRQTTRDEDMAYCLLGLLDVNMPLLYGEGGHKAFLRLQERVITTREDCTMFLYGEMTWPREDSMPLSWAPGPRFEPAVPVNYVPEVPVHSFLANSPRDFMRLSAWSKWSSPPEWSAWADAEQNMAGFGEPPQITSRGLRLSLFIREVTRQDVDGDSILSGLLKYASMCQQGGYQDFLDWLRPDAEDFAHPLYLGCFPCFSTDAESLVPCILLLDLDSLGPAPAAAKTLGFMLGAAIPRTYVRLLHFFHKLPSTELHKEGWNFTTCYIKTKAGSEVRQTLPLVENRFRWRPFLWRTPHPGISCEPHTVNQTNGHIAWEHHCFKLVDAKTHTACVIMIAVRPGYYWLHHRVGKNIDADAEAARFGAMDLSSLWVENAKEKGPFCEEQVDFGNVSLLITPWVETFRNGIMNDAWVCLYLAVTERRTG